MNLNASIRISDIIARIEQEHHWTVGVCGASLRNASEYAHRGTGQFPAASLVKLFVAYAALVEARGRDMHARITITPDDGERGNGTLANLTQDTLPLSDILYFLLAHSDNTAQRVLERTFGVDALAKHITDLHLSNTTYVPRRAPHDTRATTTPDDVVRFLRALWDGSLVSLDERTLILSALAQSHTTYYGLRHLPCTLNTQNPIIHTYYEKAGKTFDTVNDALILCTETDTLFLSIFITDIHETTNGNSVDHAGIRALATVAKVLYTTLTNNT